MFKIAVVGEKWSILGFAGLGLSIYPVEKGEDVLSIIDSIDKDYAVIFVTETFFAAVKNRFESAYQESSPLICLIPNHQERQGAGRGIIRELVRKAVGFEIE